MAISMERWGAKADAFLNKEVILDLNASTIGQLLGRVCPNCNRWDGLFSSRRPSRSKIPHSHPRHFETQLSRTGRTNQSDKTDQQYA